MGLFDNKSFNVSVALKDAMHQAAKDCDLSREQIVDAMNDLAARYGVSLANGNARLLNLATLEKWLNPNDHGRDVPVRALPIFCAVVRSAEPLKAVAEPLGFAVIDDTAQKKLAWAEANLKAKYARARMRKLESEI